MPEGCASPIAELNHGDRPVQRQESSQRSPMMPNQFSLKTCNVSMLTDPCRPQRPAGIVETMYELQKEATILHAQVDNAEPALLSGSLNFFSRHEASVSASTLFSHPQEPSPLPIKLRSELGRKLYGEHEVDELAVRDRIDQDSAPHGV